MAQIPGGGAAIPAVTVLYNPHAGRGRARAHLDRLRSVLAARYGEVHWHETTAPGDATRIAASLNEGVVFAAGGDGTVNEVLLGLAEGDCLDSVTLGVVPVGTGNDLARHLGIPNLDAYLEAVPRLVPTTLDAGEVEGGGLFLNVVACGFDAVVGQRINSGYRWLTGTTAYLAAVVESLAKYRAVPMQVRVDDHTVFEGRAMLCAVANSSSYGGGMKIAPHASLQDGQLDIVLIEEVGKVEFLRAFPRVFAGTHLSHPKVRHWSGQSVQVSSDPALPMLVDGELRGQTPFFVRCHPGHVSVLTLPNP